MYRALIVEDEDLMRDYLAAKLNDLCPEWEAAATAADGMEAVERLAHERYDAVLTDIRMPGMDGLELARYIRRTDSEMPILILSGYDEFDYARTAVRLNVFDYLLKPLNEEELSAALFAMAALVDGSRKHEAGTKLKAALEGSDPSAVDWLVTQVNGRPCGLLLLAPALMPDTDRRYDAACKMTADVEAGFMPLCAAIKDYAAIVCPADESLLVETECRGIAQHFCKTHPTLKIRCGYAALDPFHIKQCAANAQAALRLSLALDAPLIGGHLLYSQRQSLARLDSMLNHLNGALAAQQLSDERRASLLAGLGEFPPEEQFTVVLSLLVDCDLPDPLRREALKNFAISGNLLSAGIQAGYSKALDCLFTQTNFTNVPSSALVQQARDFLQLHFAGPVSLTNLADQLGITSAYLSSLFHHEMGLSYSQYLLQMRMEDAARRLLSDPNARIGDIGEAVGFPSAKHFTHVFRRYFHLSPTEYRECRGKSPG